MATPNDYGIDDVKLEQRVAELSDRDFAALVATTRFPTLPPEQAKAELARAEQRAKAQQLMDSRAESDARAATFAAGTLPAATPPAQPVEPAPAPAAEPPSSETVEPQPRRSLTTSAGGFQPAARSTATTRIAV